MAEALALLTETWRSAGPDARDIFLIQQLEQIVQTVTTRVNAVEVGEVTVVDRGDGRALAAYVAGYPAMVKEVLSELSATTGVDVPAILSRTSAAEGAR